MRASVAASPVGMEPSWLTAAVSVVTAGMGAGALWLAQRLGGKAAIQTAITGAFRELMDAHRAEIDSLRKDLKAERQSRAAEQIANNRESDYLRGEISNLTQTVETLRQRLREAGIEGIEPEAPRLRPKPMIEL